MNKYDLNSVLV